jgi:hypothetical protein
MQRAAFAWLFLGLTSCIAPSDVETPRVRSHAVAHATPLVAALNVELERATAVTVEYWSDGEAPLRVESAPAGSHRVLLSRLRANRTYHYRIAGTNETGSFATGALPADLASLHFTPSGTPSIPLVLVHVYNPDGFRGYVIVDGSGHIVWYWRTAGLPFGATRRVNGNFVFMDGQRGLVEVGVDGVVVRELAQDTAARELHHDVITTPVNTLLFLAFDRRTHEGAPLKGEAIWEWRPETGTTTRRWTSWDFFSPELDRGPRFGLEWMHANSLSIGPRGNTVMSVHYFNQIVSISPDWQRLEWRLGGVNATTTVNPGDAFSGQHTAGELSPNRVILFDNNLDSADASRALEFELSGTATAVRVWEWKPARRNLATAVGSARRMGNGHTVVTFGMSAGLNGSTGPIEVYEVDAVGQTIWHLEIGNVWLVYRAEPLSAVGREF